MSYFKFLIGYAQTEKDLDTDYGFQVTQAIGIGMPAHEERYSRYAQADGAAYDATYVPERVITLVGMFTSTSLADLHAKRKALILAINRDSVQSAPVGVTDVAHFTGEFTFRYIGSGYRADIRVRYGGGLEVEALNAGRAEMAAIRLIAVDPFFRAATYTPQTATPYTALATVNNLFMRDAGAVYSEPTATGAAGGAVRCMVVDTVNQYVYVGGSFTSMGGVANTSYIARYSMAADSWAAVGSGLTGGTGVFALALDAKKNLFIGGSFNAPSGGSANVVYRNFVSNAWAALGQGTEGADGTVRAIALEYNGFVWVGGSFDNAITAAGADVANTSRIAVWNGNAWQAFSGTYTGDASGAVNALAWDTRGLMYIGGAFKNFYGVTGNGCCLYNRSYSGMAVDTVYAMGTAAGTDADSWVKSLCLAKDKTVIAGGSFVSMGGISDTVRVARWTGSQWEPLGKGIGSGTLSASVYVQQVVTEPSTGDIWAVCNGQTLNPYTHTAPVARFMRRTWIPADFTLSENALTCMAFYGGYEGGTTFWGANFTGASATVNAPTVATYDLSGAATARTWPVFYLTRAGGTSLQLRGLHNHTTGASIHFIYDLQDGETITINLEPHMRTIESSMAGNVMSKMLPTSDLARWYLEPGNNTVSFFSVPVGSPTVTFSMQYRPAQWSADYGSAIPA